MNTEIQAAEFRPVAIKSTSTRLVEAATPEVPNGSNANGARR
jgi:hypothetical protein